MVEDGGGGWRFKQKSWGLTQGGPRLFSVLLDFVLHQACRFIHPSLRCVLSGQSLLFLACCPRLHSCLLGSSNVWNLRHLLHCFYC